MLVLREKPPSSDGLILGVCHLKDQFQMVWERDENGGALTHYINNNGRIILSTLFDGYNPYFMEGRLPATFLVDLDNRSHRYMLVELSKGLTLYRKENDLSHLQPHQINMGI